MSTKLALAVAAAFVLAAFPSRASGQAQEAATLDTSTNVLSEFINMPSEGIPRAMLTRAQGVVIVPNMVKLGFVVGGRHGKGVVVVRDQNGVWRPPLFITMTGGSVGWQAGVQSSDIVMVFNTQRSVAGLLSGKFTVGVDASAAAGPVGRQASAATDLKLQAEVFSYSRSRGLFAGASFDGSMLQIDNAANQAYYAAAGLNPDGTAPRPNMPLPQEASRLLTTLTAYADAGRATVPPVGTNLAGGVPRIDPNLSPTGMGTTPGIPAVTPPAGTTAAAPPLGSANPAAPPRDQRPQPMRSMPRALKWFTRRRIWVPFWTNRGETTWPCRAACSLAMKCRRSTVWNKSFCDIRRCSGILNTRRSSTAPSSWS